MAVAGRLRPYPIDRVRERASALPLDKARAGICSTLNNGTASWNAGDVDHFMTCYVGGL